MGLNLSIDNIFKQALNRACRTTALKQVGAPAEIVESASRLLSDSVAAARVLTSIIMADMKAQAIYAIKHSNPCCYCGHHQEKHPGMDIENTDSYEFICYKGHEIHSDEAIMEKSEGCLDYTPEGAILDRGHIKGELEREEQYHSETSAARAFRAIGQAMVDMANKELGE